MTVREYTDKRFLLVDDDSDDAHLFTEALHEVGPNAFCDTAKNGIEALLKLEKQSEIPHLIFLDINMPRMNGWECLTKIKSSEHLKDIPVIIHTTSSRKTDREIARDLGALCFFTKPNDFKKLKKMLEIVIDHIDKNQISSVCDAVYRQLNMLN